MEKAILANEPKREIFMCDGGKKVLDVHGIPFDYGKGSVLVFDVTKVVEAERQVEQERRKIYRDVIFSVTGGRLVLVERGELEDNISGGKPIFKMDLAKLEDIAVARDHLRKVLEMLPFTQTTSMRLVLCLSEAATNAIKHAGSGTLEVKAYADKLQLIVSDRGKGIDFSVLPKATLLKGYPPRFPWVMDSPSCSTVCQKYC